MARKEVSSALMPNADAITTIANNLRMGQWNRWRCVQDSFHAETRGRGGNLLPVAWFLRILLVMTRLVPDPELEQLVRELNEREAAVEGGERSEWPAAQVPSGNPLE